MTPPREEWQRLAAAAGLAVGDAVTKKTRLVVPADPDSMSGKAKKARQYRIPVVHPAAYQEILASLA
jgi:DNA polymerase III subunit epsilon